MHFLSTKHLTTDQIQRLLEKAQCYIPTRSTQLFTELPLKNKIITNLFFENSTRTRSSFEIAAHKLGAYVLNFDAARSSVQKGETLFDTADNLVAMGTDIFVIRHPEIGAPAQVATHLQDNAIVINAGDGSNEHPTQAMLDILTIQQHKPDFSNLSIAIVGDIRHSRVARSLCFALTTLNVPDIRLVGPAILLPTEIDILASATSLRDSESEGRTAVLPSVASRNLFSPQQSDTESGSIFLGTAVTPNISLHTQLALGIKDADVIVMLRIQQERITTDKTGITMDRVNLESLGLRDYVRSYCLTTDMLHHAKSDAIVMHPGPINRGIEIESAVADGPQSVILKQAQLGVAMRMAIMTTRI